MKSKSQGHQSTNTKEYKPASRKQKKQHKTFIKVVDLKEKMYSDQTGKFMYLSSKGTSYIMIAYHTDAN